MAERAKSQKIGARGHKWLLAHVEEHPHWLARELGEDFGVDAELELTEPEVRGDILKVQIKSSANVERRDGAVKFNIDRKYLDYANACRYPLLMIRVDVTSKSAWYLWLQDWLLMQKATGVSPLSCQQDSWIAWVPETQTVDSGLNDDLKRIARWEGASQLALSLTDAMHAAAATMNTSMVNLLADALASCAGGLGPAGLNSVIDEAIRLGDRMRGTLEGYDISNQLFTMVRRCGDRINAQTIDRLVLRGDSYSRSGLNSLAVLYDEHFSHISSMNLPLRYFRNEPRVAYYCAFREANPKHRSTEMFVDPSPFEYAGLKYRQPDRFWDQYANRGPSALLDALEYVDPNQSATEI
ncbi:hypothetical protein HDG34_006122 [Paraburkholderia sp. HC6.4b]|uniref:DUF4365 domain-containing protein n=1 Tax=unclassified Paraburkholderia TaxID=2615204 RepID=UPI00160FFBE8|nr:MULTISPECIES: DUF4365 domain-containing protein [unclassified Paraburkholderia]MBB5412151.1 hypothetical protein [Paraburkholderia sp. HC6.4b]MBB5454218.1 hypothetical protein [Paraburkholderia sp. Kb1A]